MNPGIEKTGFHTTFSFAAVLSLTRYTPPKIITHDTACIRVKGSPLIDKEMNVAKMGWR
jgi:hypothetical protein